MTDEFEHQHGYPPGVNQVRKAGRGDQGAARALYRTAQNSPDLATFYASVRDLSWADVGNGYFIESAREVLRRHEEYDAAQSGAIREVGGLVIGSNGGGLSYVAGPGGVVYRTRTASLDEPELDKVADDLRQFLELLEQSLTRFVSSGEPGSL
ncbi:SMI1/KNR4 family protein [Streptomyces sp. NPDC050095]|uniref:SMI1/KNR4 family protein n=1 Tax=unclassified Streptomyces TaxID=2593676 RepID=UPI003430F9C6